MPQDNDQHNAVSHAFVAIGANLPSAVGCPKMTIDLALEKLSGRGLKMEIVSDFYETPCFPAGSGPDFVNMAAKISTDLSAAEVLQILHDVEEGLGRVRLKRWGARVIDIDLIAFDDQIEPDESVFKHWQNLSPEQQKTQAPEQLILPHPRMQDRAFVLIPLRDVAPDWVHPVFNKTVSQMAADLPKAEIAAVKRLKT